MQANKQFDPRFDKYLDLFCQKVKEIIKELDESNQTDIGYFFDETSWDFVELSVQYKSESSQPHVIFPVGFFSKLDDHLTPEMTTRERNLVLECARAYRLAQELRFEKPEIVSWMTFRAEFEVSREKVLLLKVVSSPIDEVTEKIIRRSICREKSLNQKFLASNLTIDKEFLQLQRKYLGKVIFEKANTKSRNTFVKEISILATAIKDYDRVSRGEVFEISRHELPFE